MDQRSERLMQRGIAHYQRGDLIAAQACFDAVLARDEGNAPALFRSSMVAAKRGRYEDAMRLAEAVLQRETARPEVLSHLARCQFASGRIALAGKTVDLALQLPPGKPAVLEALGNLLRQFGRRQEALRLFDAALARGDGKAYLHYSRAHALIELDRREEAERDLEACLKAQPAHVKAHQALAELRPATAERNHVERLQGLLAALAPQQVGEEWLALALFKELDDLGRSPAAWQQLQRLLVARAARPVAEPALSRELFARLLAAPVAAAELAVASGTPTPVFIIGLPRAGMGLLARRLVQHSGMALAPETTSFLREIGRLLGRETLQTPSLKYFDLAAALSPLALAQRLRERAGELGKPYVLHAQPLDFLQVGAIAQVLPEARFLHLQRRSDDLLLAQLAQPARLPAGNEAVPPVHDALALADYQLAAQQLMRHWHAALPGRILDVPYESLVEKPEMMLRVICAFLDLRYESALRSGTAWHSGRIGRAEPYRHWLGEAFARLQAG
jgi:tetratricopeptide (TPR) repeat protein